MSWIFHFDAHLYGLFVSFRSSRLSRLKPADEGLIGLHIFLEFGPRETVQRSLHFAFGKSSSLLVNPEFSGKFTWAKSFANSR